MIELMEAICGFRSQNKYPIRIDVFDFHKQWIYGTWGTNDWAISFLFETCELSDCELCKWYIKDDRLYTVIMKRSSDG